MKTSKATTVLEEETKYNHSNKISYNIIPNKPYIIAIMTDYQKNTGNCVPFIRAFTKEFNSYMEKR